MSDNKAIVQELKQISQQIGRLADEVHHLKHSIVAIRSQGALDQREVLRISSAIQRIERHLNIEYSDPINEGGVTF
ncbi:hypothetical protein ACVNHC_24390 [Pannonibacter sp. Q-1]